jgi:hypothetical protein
MLARDSGIEFMQEIAGVGTLSIGDFPVQRKPGTGSNSCGKSAERQRRQSGGSDASRNSYLSLLFAGQAVRLIERSNFVAREKFGDRYEFRVRIDSSRLTPAAIYRLSA